MVLGRVVVDGAIVVAVVVVVPVDVLVVIDVVVDSVVVVMVVVVVVVVLEVVMVVVVLLGSMAVVVVVVVVSRPVVVFVDGVVVEVVVSSEVVSLAVEVGTVDVTEEDAGVVLAGVDMVASESLLVAEGLGPSVVSIVPEPVSFFTKNVDLPPTVEDGKPEVWAQTVLRQHTDNTRTVERCILRGLL